MKIKIKNNIIKSHKIMINIKRTKSRNCFMHCTYKQSTFYVSELKPN